MENKVKHVDQNTLLQWIMAREIRTILQVPSKDQIYDNISFKLGAFYKRFWQNKRTGLKQNPFKSGQIIRMAEKMQHISRQDDRWIKVCAYSREVRKFTPNQYREWKDYIWADLKNDQRAEMENYVQELSPPTPLQGEAKEDYDKRERKIMFQNYKKMKRPMLLVEVFEKIWTIRQYRKQGKTSDEQRHINLTEDILDQMKKYHPNFRSYLSFNMGLEQWNEIGHLW